MLKNTALIVMFALVLLGLCGCEEPAEPRLDETISETRYILPDRMIRLDGFFDDWARRKPDAIDPLGDATGAFDITRVYADSFGSELFICFDTTTLLNIQSGPADQGTIVIRLSLPCGTQINMDLRNRTIWQGAEPADEIKWSKINYVCAPTYADSRFELRADLAAYNIMAGSQVVISFTGSDFLDKPIKHTFKKAGVKPVRRSPDRTPHTDLRVVSLNTLKDGLLDPRRQDAFRRMLSFADADIYLFQEQWKQTDLESVLNEMLPGENKAPWNVYQNSDCAVASRGGIYPVRSEERYTAAVVEAPSCGPVLVVSVHFTCCGYIGNENDRKRVDQARSLSRLIADFRRGGISKELAVYRSAPVVLAGDYNLVGSYTPIEILTDPQTRGTKHWILKNLIGESIATWRDDEQTFSPGMLDCLVFDNTKLRPLNGFILDTTLLRDYELRMYGLRSSDSMASDHLMLVADFGCRNPMSDPVMN